MMNPNPADLANNLALREEGLWVAKTQTTSTSYPEEGSAICLSFEDDSFWFRHRNRCILAVVQRFHSRGTIWDIGGGNGFVSRSLLEAGFDVVLVEPSPAGVRTARERGIPNVVCSTLEDAGFQPGSLEAMGLFDVLEHIEDDDGFLELLHRLLSPSGRLFLTVPAHGWLWSDNDRFSGHFRRYSAAPLRRLLAAHGFQVDYLTYFFRPLVLPVFLFRSLPSWLGVRTYDVATTRREHVPKPGRRRSLLESVFDREEWIFRQGRSLSLGTSILLAASPVER